MTDFDLKQAVLEELDYDPRIDATEIDVAVGDGTVTLAGHVPTYAQKREAECIARRVKGVRAVAQIIEVRPAGNHLTADDEIARRAVSSLIWNASVPAGKVQVTVEDGRVILSGTVSWHYQRAAAERAVQLLSGVRGVSNLIAIKPSISPADVRQRIEKALKRDAELEAQRIRVQVTDSKVTLEGRVRSWAEREAAERAAWAAPGVASVVDHITIGA